MILGNNYLGSFNAKNISNDELSLIKYTCKHNQVSFYHRHNKYIEYVVCVREKTNQIFFLSLTDRELSSNRK